MRKRLGRGYVEAVRSAHPRLSAEIDFVMYWWDRCAHLVGLGQLRGAGLITTKTIAQSSNRPILRERLGAKTNKVSISFAVPNHPWHDTETTAAVRIAMTVIVKGEAAGTIQQVVNERKRQGETSFELKHEVGRIQVDLSIGAEVASASPLKSNRNLSWMGVKMSGDGFKIDAAIRSDFLASGYPNVRLPLLIAGNDLTDRQAEVFAIDTDSLSEQELRLNYPAVYQHLHNYVKPERDQNDRDAYRNNWWTFVETRPRLRGAIAGLTSYFVTCETAKHRIFVSIPQSGTLIDGSVIAVSS
jgi:hypothetical protein